MIASSTARLPEGNMRIYAKHAGAALRSMRLGLGLAVALGGVVVLVSPAARAAEGDQRCLTCHRAEGLQKPLPDGDKLLLHVDGDTFAKSVHTSVGCAGCHSDIEIGGNHPPSRKDIKDARDYAVASTEVCRGC